MKLIIAIINDDDFRAVSDELIKAGFQSTRLSSTGSFLKAGNSTLLICVETSRLDECISIIHGHCRKRTKMVPSTASFSAVMYAGMPVQVTVGGATIIVTDVERFEKL